MRGVTTLAIVLALASTCPAVAPALAADAPDYQNYREGRFLRYLNAEEGGQIGAVPRIGLSFGGGGAPLHAELDSGSTGIVVAAAYIPGFESLPSKGEGKLTYTSSGRVMVGQWVVTPVTLSGKEGASLTTAPMPVLAVTEVQCLERARDCTPREMPEHIAMVGVGFAREGDLQSQSTPDKNPLLRIEGGEGPRRQGYILSPEGVHIGLTRENTRGDFRFLKLERNRDGTDWAPTPACLSLNGATPPACGTLLVDTGVSVMYLTLPQAQTQGQEGTLQPGSTLSVYVGREGDGFELYSFAAGDGSPLTPSAIHLRVADKPFVNTSFHLLNGYDVLFDAEGGYVGFRRR